MSDKIRITPEFSKEGIGTTIEALFKGMETMVSSKAVIGQPFECGDAKIIPLIEISAGMASGAVSGKNGKNGAGAMSTKMTPIAMLILQKDHVRLINVKNQDVLTKIMEMVPDMIDIFTKSSVSPEAKEKAREMINDMEIINGEGSEDN